VTNNAPIPWIAKCTCGRQVRCYTRDCPRAANEFPDGSLGSHDEGELTIGVTHDKNGLVHVNFGKPIEWFALLPEQALELANAILSHVGVEYE
jgi:hypothetical protein